MNEITIKWVKDKRIRDEVDLSRFAEELDIMESPEMDGYETVEKRERIKV